MTHEYQPSVDGDARGRLEEKIRSLGIEDDAQVLAMRKLVQSESDRRVEAGVKRFREETLPVHLEKELAAREAKKPEEVLAIKERSLELAQRLNMDYRTIAALLLAEGDIDTRINSFEEAVQDSRVAYVEEKLKLGGVNPAKSQNVVWDGQLNRNDVRRMTAAQITEASKRGRLDSLMRGGK